MLNKKISCNGSRNCRGEMDTGSPGMAGALGTAGYMALRDRSPHPRHQVPNTPALAAALLQLLDPLNVKLDVFLPKPGPACKGSGRIVVSPPLPQQQQQGGANLKKSTKASFFLRGVTPCRYRAKWTLLPAQAATGLWPNKAYQSSFLLKKKKITWIKMLQLLLLISSASPPLSSTKRSTPVRAVPWQAEAMRLLQASNPVWGCPRPAPFPAAEEHWEHLWSFCVHADNSMPTNYRQV